MAELACEDRNRSVQVWAVDEHRAGLARTNELRENDA
jgi:hypothetical protein